LDDGLRHIKRSLVRASVLAKLQILPAVLHALPAVHHALLAPAQFPFAASAMVLADQLSLTLLSTIWNHQKSF
jgi:hypothetical protein